MHIRPYQSKDRTSLRKLACDTADRGEPLENFFVDREFIADILMNYYTDYEPQSTWVAEENNTVFGYIAGCLNTEKYNHIMALNILPKAFFRAIFRKSFWNKKTYFLLLSIFKTWVSGGFSRDIPFQKYPAHLHINIDRKNRGQHTGQALMEKFLEKIKGVHLSTRGDNINGRKFFEKMGFSLFKCYPVFMSDGIKCIKTSTAIYVHPVRELHSL